MTGAARWDGLAIRLHQSLLCPHRLMLGPSPRCRRAQVPKSPAVCSRPPFPLPPVSLSAPSLAPLPDALLFSLLPPHAFLLFTVCYSSSFLTSRLPPRCRRRHRRGQLFNTSLPSGKPGVSFSFEESGKSEPLSSIYFIFVSTTARAMRDGVR